MNPQLGKAQIKNWLNLVSSNLPIGVVILNEAGGIVEFNERIRSFWDCISDEKLQGVKIDSLIKPFRPFSDILEHVRKTGHIEVDDFAYYTKGGKTKWAKLEGWILKEEKDGVITGWTWVDITSIFEKKQGEGINFIREILNTIFEEIPLMYVLWEVYEDFSTKILGFNHESEKVMGYSSAEILGRNFLDISIPEAWKEPLRKYIQEMRNNPKPYLGGHPLFNKKGEEIYIRWLDIPILFRVTSRLWIVSIGENMQERIETERKLRESEERYRRIVNSITDYFYHVKIENGVVVETIHMPGCEAVTGYTIEDFKANPYLWYEMVYDEDKPLVLDFAESLMRGENKGPITHRIIRKDGQIRWIRNMCLLIFNEEGKLVGYDSIIRDVTSEVIAQETLKKSEARYRNIIESLIEGYFEIDLNGNIRFANPALSEIFGFDDPKFLINKNLIDFIEVNEQSKVSNLLEEVKQSKKTTNLYEWSLTTKNGEVEKIVEASLLPILNQSGRVIGFSGIVRDITGRKRQTEQLWQIQKWESLGILVGGIAHDFNNLLMVMQGHLDLEEAEYPSDRIPYEVMVHHKNIQDAITRASELCKQMMIYSGKSFAIQKEPEQLNDIIKNIKPVLETAITKKINLDINLCKEDTTIQCDRVLIRQVILSLVTNSAEAIDNKRGTIMLQTRIAHYDKTMLSLFVMEGLGLTDGDYVELTIQDDGEGIDPQNMDKIFDPFFTTKFLGRGLGLSTVLGIVQGHKGGMKVESKLGVGTKIIVIFPHALLKEALVNTLAEKEKAKDVILLVESDSILQNVFEKIMKMKGFDVLCVDNIDKSLDVLSSPDNDIKLVILDLGITETGEKKLLEYIRKKTKKTPVIVCSDSPEEGIPKEYKDIIVACLRKPCTINEIINTIDKIWKGHN